jgi:UDP-arabinose 4-epimerase
LADVPQSRSILVTGGAGYIGAHACKALAQCGYEPVAFDNLACGHQDSVRWGPFEQGDIGDRKRLDEVIARYRPEAVMHFAAFAYVGESVTNPGKYYGNNVSGTLTLLEAIRDHSIGRVVFSSSCATYGVPEQVPIGEDCPQHPINPYGRSKLMAEQMLRDFGTAHGIRSISLRYFNAAGADPDGEVGELHEPETHLIPLALGAAAGTAPPLSIYGDDYPTPDGTCVRDYIHVTDLADAHVIGLERLLEGGGSDVYNLGAGRGTSVREVLGTVARVTGREVPHSVAPRRPGDPPVLVSDTRKVATELGWKPRLSDVETIIATAWEWHLRNAR